MMHCALIVVVTLLLTACATSPLGNPQLQFFPEEQMNQMGAAAYQQVKQKTPEVSDSQINQYVTCVAGAITDELESDTTWEVTVFKDPAVNAFALPGGKIGVYTGLLEVAKTPDQLAAVLGHEVAHVLAEHGNARVSAAYATQAGLTLAQILAGGASQGQQQLFGLLGLGAEYGILMPYGRSQETEADLLGLDLMASAGFNPHQSIELWRNMAQAGGQQPPEFLSTHPSHETRIEILTQRMSHALKLYQRARAKGETPHCG
jgi:predicted Zn-dependent protease